MEDHRLNRIFADEQARPEFTKLVVEFNEQLGGQSKRLEVPAASLIDIQATGGMLIVSYHPKKTTKINTEIVQLSSVRTIFFDAISIRSKQPFE